MHADSMGGNEVPVDLINLPLQGNMNLVANEVVRARNKFPSNNKLLAALMEEVGELAAAMLQRKSEEEVKKEAIQVACVAIRLLEEGDGDFSNFNWDPAP